MHQHAAAQIERTLHTGRHIGDLDVRHPLQRKVSIFSAARAQANDGYAQVVHQIFLAPKRILTRAEHTRVEAHLSLVFGNGDVGAEDGADAWDKGSAHGLSPGWHRISVISGEDTVRSGRSGDSLTTIGPAGGYLRVQPHAELQLSTRPKTASPSRRRRRSCPSWRSAFSSPA